MAKKYRFILSVFCVLYSALFLVIAGCGPTYPKERIKEAIVDLCKREYKTDVKVTTVGKTIGIYIPLSNLIDFSFSISKEASEKINDVLLSVTRVTISTDADYDFYCVIAHDIRIPEIQMVIIKSVDDVKRFLLSDISRGDYSKRMIIDMRLSPQAQKERTIKEVFEKMRLDSKWQEEVLNDFFRTEPSELGDIGYWNDKFYIKDIFMPEFLAEQLASRIKLEFKDDPKLYKDISIRSSRGEYKTKGAKKFFVFEVTAAAREGLPSVSDTVLRKVIGMVAVVLRSYRFTDFDYVDVIDKADNRILRVSREDLEKYRLKKLTLDDLVKSAHNVVL